MPYDVMTDDNFRFADPSARTGSGRYETAEDAAAHCRKIVDQCLAEALEPGMSAEDLWSSYKMFGEDPFIVARGSPPASFSAWDYARERCQVLCP